MQFTADSSNRTQDISKISAIALCNNIRFAVVLKPCVKKKLFNRLSNKVPRLLVQIHCAALTFCLKNNITEQDFIRICHDGFSSRWLKYYLKQNLGNLSEKIIFASVGKHDNAHKHANKVRKEVKKADMILTEEQILEYIKN